MSRFLLTIAIAGAALFVGHQAFGAEQTAASRLRGDAAKDDEANDGCDARGLAA